MRAETWGFVSSRTFLVQYARWLKLGDLKRKDTGGSISSYDCLARSARWPELGSLERKDTGGSVFSLSKRGVSGESRNGGVDRDERMRSNQKLTRALRGLEERIGGIGWWQGRVYRTATPV